MIIHNTHSNIGMLVNATRLGLSVALTWTSLTIFGMQSPNNDDNDHSENRIIIMVHGFTLLSYGFILFFYFLLYILVHIVIIIP